MTDTFDPQKMTFSEQQQDCLVFIEQTYMLEGLIPTVDRIADVFGVSKVTANKWLSSDKFQYVLKYKGITTARTSGVLSVKQLTLINMLLNISDKRSQREKFQEAGVTPQQFAAWRKDPQFNDYMQKRAEDLFKGGDAAAYLSVLKNVDSGDLNATKFYFELTGKYQPSVRHDINIDSFLVSLIEILQARVSDSRTLELIAEDIENLMQGKPILSSVKTQVAIPVSSVEAKSVVAKGDMNIALDLVGKKEN